MHQIIIQIIKYDQIEEYTNRSSLAVCKKVTKYDLDGNKIKTYNSIADAARDIIEESDDFTILCSTISGLCRGHGQIIKDFRFSYEDVSKLDKLKLFRNYPIIQVFPDGKEVEFTSATEASKLLNITQGGIHKVLRGERKSYKGCFWKKKE